MANVPHLIHFVREKTETMEYIGGDCI